MNKCAGHFRRLLFTGFCVSIVVQASAQNPRYEVVYNFLPPPEIPYCRLIQGADGSLYGTTQSGGFTNQGTVFKITTSGAVTVLHSFSGMDGAEPRGGLVLGSDGNFYGTTSIGGATGNGTVFKLDFLGVVTTLHSFTGSDGATPYAALIRGTDGNLYGTTYAGGSANLGTVFKVDSSGTVSVIHSFAGQPSDGANPYAQLTKGTDGNLYGTTSAGGASNNGIIFKIDSSGVLTALHSFGGEPLDGATPYAELLLAADGKFYGTTKQGGAGGFGAVFRMDSSGVVTILHSFAVADGWSPVAGLIQGSDGTFYGTAFFGSASNDGTIFKMDSSGVVTTLHSFAGGPSDGSFPYGTLMLATDGNFYGTTQTGGDNLLGTVFKMNSAGVVMALYSLTSDGALPYSKLIQARDGNFYGTTYNGGPVDKGTIFKMDSSGGVTVMHSFSGSDGANPVAGLLEASNGNFYGTTESGGTAGDGTVFKMDSSGAVTVLHSFAGPPLDGTTPHGVLIQASDGNFYGTTTSGGAADQGTVFKMDSSGAVTILHSFAVADGADPEAGLIQASDGNFYGTTLSGGSDNGGTIFKMNLAGMVMTMYSFGGDPENPYGGLIQASDGNFYGTALTGAMGPIPGKNVNGAIFKMDSSGSVTIVHTFAGQPSDGAVPRSELIQASDGNFYGTTVTGGTDSKGTAFKMDPSGVVTVLHSFAGLPKDGALPNAALVQGKDGNLYGTALRDTSALLNEESFGTIFRIDLAAPPVQLRDAVSRKTHGTAGRFDVDLPLTGSPAIEPRSGGPNGDYQLVFMFSNPLTSVDGARVTTGSGSVASSAVDPGDAHNYIVNLTGVTNAQTIAVSLTNVADSLGDVTMSVAISMRVLVGDVNGNGLVDSGDVFLVRQQTGQAVTSSNFREDVNATGVIDSGDVFVTRQQTTTARSIKDVFMPIRPIRPVADQKPNLSN